MKLIQQSSIQPWGEGHNSQRIQAISQKYIKWVGFSGFPNGFLIEFSKHE